MKVSCELQIHEGSGIGSDCLSVNSHDKNPNLVSLRLPEEDINVVVKAEDLIRAIKNATNIRKVA